MPTSAPNEAFPARLQPMFAQLAKAPFRDPAWLFEPKLDGYRMLAFLHGGELRLASRRGLDYTRLFPATVDALRASSERDCIVDGELIALGRDGKPSFNALQNRTGLATEAEIAAAERRAPAVFFAFDLLHHAGRNLRGLPYVQRRERLHELKAGARLQLVHADDDGLALYAAALDAGFEGVVAKRKASIYQAGKRSADWLKIKRTTSAEFVIGGYSRGQGERARFGSLVVGYHDDEQRLRYAANVGIGFDDATIDALLARFAPLVVPRSPFAERVPVRAGTTWLEPALVAEVTFAEWTPQGHLRAPVFLRLRDDIDPASVRRSDEVPAAAAAPRTASPAAAARRDASTATAARALLAALAEPVSSLAIGEHRVRLTNLARIYWPADATLGTPAITKLDLVRHWLRVAPLALPHLHDRPLTLFRWPGGIQGRRVLQKHPETALPPFVETATVWSATKNADDVYLLCNNLATLVWLAEIGALELHVWHSRIAPDARRAGGGAASGSAARLAASSVDRPDYMLFDLDPYLYSGREARGGEPEPNPAGFEQCRRVAFALKAVLDRMALRSCVKTSGKTGLHVVVPIVPKLRYALVRRIAKTICRHLLEAQPEVVTTEWSTGERAGKVFLDFNMNVRGKSIIAPYGPRGLPGAPVSMPLTWRELADAEPGDFRVSTLGDARRRRDAWAPVVDDPQDLEAVLSRGA